VPFVSLSTPQGVPSERAENDHCRRSNYEKDHDIGQSEKEAFHEFFSGDRHGCSPFLPGRLSPAPAGYRPDAYWASEMERPGVRPNSQSDEVKTQKTSKSGMPHRPESLQ
jgi:hypothetical protein